MVKPMIPSITFQLWCFRFVCSAVAVVCLLPGAAQAQKIRAAELRPFLAPFQGSGSTAIFTRGGALRACPWLPSIKTPVVLSIFTFPRFAANTRCNSVVVILAEEVPPQRYGEHWSYTEEQLRL